MKKVYEPIPKQYITRSGKKHWKWKGNKVGYVALHAWIYKKKGKPIKCELCGTTKIPKGKKRWFNWCYKGKKYSRNLKKWRSLCIPCHRKCDDWKNKIKKAFLKSECWKKRLRDASGKFI